MTIDDRLGQLFSFDEAMQLLADMEAARRDVWGPEGFRIRADGSREARMELILDLSREGIGDSAADRIEKARAFMVGNQGPDIAWEIWAP